MMALLWFFFFGDDEFTPDPDRTVTIVAESRIVVAPAESRIVTIPEG